MKKFILTTLLGFCFLMLVFAAGFLAMRGFQQITGFSSKEVFLSMWIGSAVMVLSWLAGEFIKEW